MLLRMSLPLAGAEVEAQAGLSQDADLPAVQVVKGLHQALGALAPAAELGDKSGVNLAGLRQGEDLFAFRAVMLRMGLDAPPLP